MTTRKFSKRAGKRRLSSAARQALLVGVGSVGRPCAVGLSKLEISHLSLVDPKSYQPRSLETQCEPQEVHRRKVDVVAEITRRAGLDTSTYATDITCVPDGIVGSRTVVVSCVDNSQAVIGSNRKVFRMGGKLIKVNVEPMLGCVALRAYDLSRRDGPCAECQMSDRHYQESHPRSCDAPAMGRRTAGSRQLSEEAAQLALQAVCDILRGGAHAEQWWNWEVQWFPSTGQTLRSRLERYPNCRWNHASTWPNLRRLREAFETLRLSDLISRTHRSSGSDVEFVFDQQVALQGCCSECLRRASVVRWVTGVDVPVGRCPKCGGPLAAVAFAMRQHLTLNDLAAVLDAPLPTWGVLPGAVIQVRARGHDRSFVVGNPIRHCPATVVSS
jgi:hypothetical protein